MSGAGGIKTVWVLKLKREFITASLLSKLTEVHNINLIFPHQLFEDCPLLKYEGEFVLVEEHLFFKKVNFHKQKIAFHRASMKFYEEYLSSLGKKVRYVESGEEVSDVRELIKVLQREGIKTVNAIDPTDNYLNRRLKDKCEAAGLKLQMHDSPLFINKKDENADFFKPTKKKFYQTKFYTEERKKRNILVSGDGLPEGGKWTYDVDNRKKYPAKKTPPPIHFPDQNSFYTEAKTYVETHFKGNIGELSPLPLYPTDFNGSKAWLQQFFENRFHEFGVYEDAIVKGENILNHSVLTPMMNTGLLTPQFVLDEALKFGKENGVPLNSLEGFLRQIMGWREFIRGVYEAVGSKERTTNFWGFERKIPASFYDGTTGIPPVDDTIKMLLKTGYNHHIERLMVLGNFMVLCEFHPDEVYRWFMEMYIDSYDWVMVTNVYGMSQFADGGLMASKPYISGSNYLMKMSDYKKGDWQKIWDGLFWRFMHVHRDFFLKNPRLGMLVRTFDKMSDEKRNTHIENGERFLTKL